MKKKKTPFKGPKSNGSNPNPHVAELERFLLQRPRRPQGLRDAKKEAVVVPPAAPKGKGSGKPRATTEADISPVVRRLEKESSDLKQAVLAGQTWQREATDRLHALPSALTGAALKAAQHLLLSQLSTNSLSVSKSLARQGRWHAAHKAATEAVRLRKEEALRTLGSPIGVGPKTHLQLAHTTFMLSGNSPDLRSKLKTAIQEYPNHVGLAYWSARYHLMGAQFKEAYQAIEGHLGTPRLLTQLLPLLDYSYAKSPEEAYPCNFYLYRYTIFPPRKLEAAREQLVARIADDDPNSRERMFRHVIEAWDAWNRGNADMGHRRYGSAEAYYLKAREHVLGFFKTFDPDRFDAAPSDAEGVYTELVKIARAMIRQEERPIYLHFRHRYQTITLPELFNQDWERPLASPSGLRFYDGDEFQFMHSFYAGFYLVPPAETAKNKILEKVCAPLLSLGLIHTSLALAESRRMRRRFREALSECRQVLRRHDELKILSQFIEVPFVKILMGQIMLEKGDAEYKARTLSTPGDPDSGLKARKTYRGVLINFADQGQYVDRVNRGAAKMHDDVNKYLTKGIHPLTRNPNRLTPEQRLDFLKTLQSIPIPTVSLRRPPGKLVGLHEPLLRFRDEADKPLLGETNPLIYQIVLTAKARMLQLEAGLNYLGYTDDYVPPWRFNYLLERARYFTGHAKTTQSDYLNYLTNAEREEFQEQSQEQRVAEERQNVRTERSRVEQSRAELNAATEARELADLVESNAKERLRDKDAFEIFGSVVMGGAGGAALALSLVGGVIGTAFAPGVGTLVGMGVGAVIGIGIGVGAGLAFDQQMDEQRDLERAVGEAARSAEVAQANRTAAAARLRVAILQHGVAVMRHDFAVQSLFYLRNRTLTAEMWYRLAHLIRSVADTYLRYAVEVSFLAEQAYEFEADRRLDVIRFDYDVDEVAGMLAADFLSADLDTLERDLLVTEQTRQQQVRFAVSLAREFPSALAELRDKGAAIFSLTLERLERRFGGVFNLRVGTVEVLPVALMDPTGFSLELTHLGDGQVRLNGSGESEDSTATATWLSTDPSRPAPVDVIWPMRRQVLGPETAVYTGLTRVERDNASPMFGPAERNAFERRPAASSWRIDLDMKENRIVPETIADVLITFNLTGYHNATLRDEIERMPKPKRLVRQLISGHSVFPDQFYDFNQNGVMAWPVTREVLSLAPPSGELRNIAVALVPTSRGPDFGNLFNRFEVEISLSSAGILRVLTLVPHLEFEIQRRTVKAHVRNIRLTANVRWDFGDENILGGARVEHTYAAAGTYNATLRIDDLGRLSEFSFVIKVASDRDCAPPVTAFPVFLVTDNTLMGTYRVRVSPGGTVAGDPVGIAVRVQGTRIDARGAITEFELAPNRRYVVGVRFFRRLNVHFFSDQRFVPETTLPINFLQTQSNRTFDGRGVEILHEDRNAFAQHVFSAGAGALSPGDDWYLETPLSENPALLSHDPSKPDFSQIQDALLLLEYEVE
jgi:hypothetical protein